MALTSPALIAADRALGNACELLVELLELFVPPLKHYRSVRGLDDLGPLIPEWSAPTPTPMTKAAAAAAASASRIVAATTTADKRVHPTIVIETLPGVAA